MKYWLILLLLVNIISCDKSNNNVIKIGHIGEFDYDIWMQIDEELKKENADLDIVFFDDYNYLNKALDNGEIDLNAFQNHIYFVNDTNANNYKFHILEKTFLAPMNIYSTSITNISQITTNSKIAIPNDGVNLSRALQVLSSAGLIKLQKFDSHFYSITNIIENNLNLEIIPIESDMIYYNMGKLDAAIINYGFISDYRGYNIVYYDDISKYSHSASNSYANLIVCREKDKSIDIYKLIASSYKKKIKEQIEENKLKGLISIY